MRFPSRLLNRRAADKGGESELSVDAHFGPERRVRSMSNSTRFDLFFLSLWLMAVAGALLVFLSFCVYQILRSLSS